MDDQLIKEIDFQLLSKIVVGIGEVSEITGVPKRQIRYWEEKSYILSRGEAGTTRKYDYATIKTIVLIKELIDEGYILEKAVEKVHSQSRAINHAFKELEKLSHS